MELFSSFLTLLPDIESILADKGVEVPRPNYEREKSEAKTEVDSEDEDDASTLR